MSRANVLLLLLVFPLQCLPASNPSLNDLVYRLLNGKPYIEDLT
jgi:hypothetical protein